MVNYLFKDVAPATSDVSKLVHLFKKYLLSSEYPVLGSQHLLHGR